MAKKSSWQSSQFAEQDTDPLAGFANIMDVMLVFSLGLMLALVAQSPDLQRKIKLSSVAGNTGQPVTVGKELVEAPESMQQALKDGAQGMQSLGQVYKDPKTGKLILVGGE